MTGKTGQVATVLAAIVGAAAVTVPLEHDGRHCRHWYDDEGACCRCGNDGPEEGACPGRPAATVDRCPLGGVHDPDDSDRPCERCGASPR